MSTDCRQCQCTKIYRFLLCCVPDEPIGVMKRKKCKPGAVSSALSPAEQAMAERAAAAGPGWRAGLSIGDMCDARDARGHWYASKVEELRTRDGSGGGGELAELRVHFLGWSKKWDIWLARSDESLQPLGSRQDANPAGAVGRWRAVKEGTKAKDSSAPAAAAAPAADAAALKKKQREHKAELKAAEKALPAHEAELSSKRASRRRGFAPLPPAAAAIPKSPNSKRKREPDGSHSPPAKLAAAQPPKAAPPPSASALISSAPSAPAATAPVEAAAAPVPAVALAAAAPAPAAATAAAAPAPVSSRGAKEPQSPRSTTSFFGEITRLASLALGMAP
eukprot:SAG11_NODE_4988_length_1702_cov_1.116656_1_plen_334_part_01